MQELNELLNHTVLQYLDTVQTTTQITRRWDRHHQGLVCHQRDQNVSCQTTETTNIFEVS